MSGCVTDCFGEDGLYVLSASMNACVCLSVSVLHISGPRLEC